MWLSSSPADGSAIFCTGAGHPWAVAAGRSYFAVMSDYYAGGDDDPLAEHLPIIYRYLKPCIGFELDRQPAALEASVGRSRFGGGPDVPTDFLWPRRRGVKLDFLLQVDLAEVAKFDPHGLFPHSGMLSFFFDLKRAPGAADELNAKQIRVFHFLPGQLLRRQAPPHPEVELEEAALVFWESLTLPTEGAEFDELVAELDDGYLEWDTTQETAYTDLCDDVFQQNSPHRRRYSNRLGGYAALGHGDMQREAELASRGVAPREYVLRRRSARAAWTMRDEDVREWTMLLQLDAERDLHLPGIEALHCWTPDASLEKESLARAWATVYGYDEKWTTDWWRSRPGGGSSPE